MKFSKSPGTSNFLPGDRLLQPDLKMSAERINLAQDTNSSQPHCPLGEGDRGLQMAKYCPAKSRDIIIGVELN